MKVGDRRVSGWSSATQDKTGLPCCWGDLGYFSSATFWLLAEPVPTEDSEASFLGELQAQG